MLNYLNSVFLGANAPGKIGPRNTSELRMLAEAMDHLQDGNLAQVADILKRSTRGVVVIEIRPSLIAS